jgi:hypothetical protein
MKGFERRGAGRSSTACAGVASTRAFPAVRLTSAPFLVRLRDVQWSRGQRREANPWTAANGPEGDGPPPNDRRSPACSVSLASPFCRPRRPLSWLRGLGSAAVDGARDGRISDGTSSRRTAEQGTPKAGDMLRSPRRLLPCPVAPSRASPSRPVPSRPVPSRPVPHGPLRLIASQAGSRDHSGRGGDGAVWGGGSSDVGGCSRWTLHPLLLAHRVMRGEHAANTSPTQAGVGRRTQSTRNLSLREAPVYSSSSVALSGKTMSSSFFLPPPPFVRRWRINLHPFFNSGSAAR